MSLEKILSADATLTGVVNKILYATTTSGKELAKIVTRIFFLSKGLAIVNYVVLSVNLDAPELSVISACKREKIRKY